MNELKRKRNMFQKNKKKYKQFGYRDRRKLKNKPEVSYIIAMKFPNGTKKDFVVSSKGDTFEYNKGIYIIDTNQAFYNISMNQYELEYYYGCPEPVNKRPYKEDENNVFNIISPQALKNIVTGKYIEKILEDEGYAKIVKAILVIAIIQVIITLIQIFMKTNGG